MLSQQLNSGIALNPTADMGNDADLQIFKLDLKQLLRGALGWDGGRTGHMTKYDYSAVIPEYSLDSGADSWDRVTLLGGKTGYYIPSAEGEIVFRNTNYFKAMFPESPMVMDLGPGGNYAIDLKSYPTFKAVGGKHYVAFDINKNIGVNASRSVKQKNPSITTSYVHGDFTKPHKPKLKSPVLMMMWGCTISQFPFSRKGQESETTLGELLNNLGNMVNDNALLIATIDTNTFGPNAKSCYNGAHFDQFKRHFWLTAKTLVDSSLDPDNNYVSVHENKNTNLAEIITYSPKFDGDGIVHSFITEEPITFVIDGEQFDIPRGTRIDTGFSKKWSAEEATARIEESGWEVLNQLSDGQSTVRALVIAGRNVSKEQKQRARGHTIGNIRGNAMLGANKLMHPSASTSMISTRPVFPLSPFGGGPIQATA